MAIVNFDDEIGERELQLMRPQPAGFRARREIVPLAEEQQDIGGLADDELAGLEERRREQVDAATARPLSSFVMAAAPLRLRAIST